MPFNYLSPSSVASNRMHSQILTTHAAGQNLRKLYATVEDDHPRNLPVSSPAQSSPSAPAGDSDHMQLDDSKHKVYIYNLDDELTSDESEPDEGKVVFLPDIERALRANRIPPVVRANSEGQLAGKNLDDMQLVLYNVPSSLTVAPEHDSVRKAIIEARARARARREGKEEPQSEGHAAPTLSLEAPPMSGNQGELEGFANGGQQASMPEDVDAMDLS